MRQGRWAVTCGLLLLVAGPVAAADAERGAVTVGGGIFAPFNGDVGGAALLGAEGRVSEHISVGGEVGYQRFDAEVTGVFSPILDTVQVDAVHLRALARYTWNPGIVRPYVGAGGGIGIYDYTSKGGGGLGIDGTGVSFGLFGLAGLDVPLGSRISLFAEGRVAGDLASYALFGEQFGGASGLSGARVRF